MLHQGFKDYSSSKMLLVCVALDHKITILKRNPSDYFWSEGQCLAAEVENYFFKIIEPFTLTTTSALPAWTGTGAESAMANAMFFDRAE